MIYYTHAIDRTLTTQSAHKSIDTATVKSERNPVLHAALSSSCQKRSVRSNLLIYHHSIIYKRLYVFGQAICVILCKNRGNTPTTCIVLVILQYDFARILCVCILYK